MNKITVKDLVLGIIGTLIVSALIGIFTLGVSLKSNMIESSYALKEYNKIIVEHKKNIMKF